MAAGSIVIDLLLRTGSFETDTNRATKNTEKRFREMERTISDVGAKIGLAMGATAAAAAVWSKSLIDGLDALNDVADATGASIEKISGLEDVALRTGTSMETVTGALVKFNDVLKDADGKNGASEALKRIGLDAADLRKLDPADALMKTAVALSQFANDGDKARLVQELFGKSTKEVAALLKDLAEKGKIVGTVTTDQTAAAEAFNKQLAAMHKNATDVGRAIMGSLLPALNSIADKARDQGLMALLGFDKNFFDTKAVAGFVGEMKFAQEEVNRLKAAALKGTATQAQVIAAEAALEDAKRKFREADRKFLRPAGMDADSLRRFEIASYPLPSVGPAAKKDGKEEKGPKPPDPDADFKSYLDNLERQIQGVNELTVSEKLLDDLRRGSLSVSNNAQFERLWALTQEADAIKALRTEQEASDRRTQESNREVQKNYEDMKAAGKSVLEATRTPLERMNAEFVRLNDLLKENAINWDTHGRAIIAVQDEYDRLTKTVSENLPVVEDFAHIAGGAMHDLVLGGGSASAVFKQLLKDIAAMVLQLGVIEPMMDRIRVAMGGKAKNNGFDFGGALLGAIGGAMGGAWSMSVGDSLGMSIAGTYGSATQAGLDDLIGSLQYRAGGGPVEAGQPYIVGERRPELFVPRTPGVILPGVPAGGRSEGPPIIINQTTGRVDNVVEQRVSPTQRAWILQENRAAFLGAMADPNSPESRAMQRNFGMQRRR